MQDRERTLAVVDNLNVRHRNAQLAGRASVELHTLIFFRNRTTLADARVVKVGESAPACRPAGELGGALLPGSLLQLAAWGMGTLLLL
jgi:hypothetical protein